MRFATPAALMCCLAATPLAAQTAAEKQATVAYVKSLQTPAGGFRPAAAAKEPTLRATSAAIRALHYLGAEVPNQKDCARFIRACFDEASGGFADVPGGKPDVFSTAVGIMAALPLGIPAAAIAGPTRQYLDQHARDFEDIRIAVAGLERSGEKSTRAAEWLQQVEQLRNSDGTYGQGKGAARATGGSVVAVLRLGGKVERPAAIIKTLDDGQRPDGGFGKEDADVSDLEKPARATDLRAFVGKCRNADGGYGAAPGQPSSVGATYFAAIILHWLDE
jgi:prenyltransferase beta subunit